MTDTAIRLAKAEASDRKLADSKGLFLLVTASGSKLRLHATMAASVCFRPIADIRRVANLVPMYSTDRLHLRPGRPNDAPALFCAIADQHIVRNLSSAPWPYSIADAERLASLEFNPNEPRLFIFREGTDPAELIGVAGLDRMPNGEVELGYWIAKKRWNRGYASEAGRLMIEIARTELKLARLFAGYFIDNPPSGRVLEKLGFVPTPELVDRHSCGRGGAAPCQMCTLVL